MEKDYESDWDFPKKGKRPTDGETELQTDSQPDTAESIEKTNSKTNPKRNPSSAPKTPIGNDSENSARSEAFVKNNQKTSGTRNGGRWIPYLLAALAILFGLCLLLNLFCNRGNCLQENPSAHKMGFVGYYICYGLFGMFGVSALLIPILLGVLSLGWMNYKKEGFLKERCGSAVCLLLTFGSWWHILSLAFLQAEDRVLNAEALIFRGAAMWGGGLICGGIGYGIIRFFSMLGGALLSTVFLLIAFFFYVGVSPRKLILNFRNRSREKQKNKNQSPKAGKPKAIPERSESAKVTPATVSEAQRPKKTSRSVAPMPMPFLNAAEEDVDSPAKSSELYLPADIRPEIEKNERKAIPASRKEVLPDVISEKETVSVPKAFDEDLPEMPSEELFPVGRKDPFLSLDSEVKEPPKKPIAEPDIHQQVEKIFPKANGYVPPKDEPTAAWDDRLKNIFIELDDFEGFSQNTIRKKESVPLSPEVPMEGDGTAERVLQRDRSGVPDIVLNPVEEQPRVQQPIVPKKTAVSKSPSAVKAPVAPKKEAFTPAPPVQKPYAFPPLSYLHQPEAVQTEDESVLLEGAERLGQALNDFKIAYTEIKYSCGPAVTRYEVVLAPGVKSHTLIGLSDDIGMSMFRDGVRIYPIPSKQAIAVEVPNTNRRMVYLRNLLDSDRFSGNPSKLTCCLGVDVTGAPVYFDISKTPHLLVGGATGMGKSVCINCFIMSILYKAKPDEVKLILIDPKQVEFKPYEHIPHLLAPVVAGTDSAPGALAAAVDEMESRFSLIKEVGVRNIEGYNAIIKDDPERTPLPYLVIIIDELADLMMVARDAVETPICRLAQKGRAAGIHLIIGTQRPSVNVVTGTIKANVPSRIACTVQSHVDSQTILDMKGAEKLAGTGDMLFKSIGAMKPTRVQGAFVSDKEVEKICDFVRSNNGNAVYDESFISKMKKYDPKGNSIEESAPANAGEGGNKKDKERLYLEALRVIVEENRASTSFLQRKLTLGYNSAANIMERLEKDGYISAADGAKCREILISREEAMEKYYAGVGKTASDDFPADDAD